MAGAYLFSTVLGIVLGALVVVGNVWLNNRNQIMVTESDSPYSVPLTSKAGKSPAVRRGKCEFCYEQGAPIRACNHAYHETCYSHCGNKCRRCPE
uniref:Putative secreted protein n=1 Tax=Anopheles darlingi TaxID=43151 RepID=A0A2M4CIV5_ANODA